MTLYIQKSMAESAFRKLEAFDSQVVALILSPYVVIQPQQIYT